MTIPPDTMMDAADLARACGYEAAVNATQEAIAAYLDAEADKTPRARTRALTLRIAASNVRAGFWRNDDA